jgi:hypothetical protein
VTDKSHAIPIRIEPVELATIELCGAVNFDDAGNTVVAGDNSHDDVKVTGAVGELGVHKCYGVKTHWDRLFREKKGDGGIDTHIVDWPVGIKCNKTPKGAKARPDLWISRFDGDTLRTVRKVDLWIATAWFMSQPHNVWIMGWIPSDYFIKHHTVPDNAPLENTWALDLNYLEHPEDLRWVYPKGAHAGTKLGNFLATTPGAMFNPDEELEV